MSDYEQGPTFQEAALERMILLPRPLKPSTCKDILKSAKAAGVSFPPNIARLLREIAEQEPAVAP